MNTIAIVIALTAMVASASGLGYNSYNTYNNYPSIHGNSWDSWGSSRGGRILSGGWNLGRRSSYRRHKRAAVGYGSYDPYRNTIGSHIGGGFNRRLGSWSRRSNSGWGSNFGWNRYGY